MTDFPAWPEEKHRPHRRRSLTGVRFFISGQTGGNKWGQLTTGHAETGADKQ